MAGQVTASWARQAKAVPHVSELQASMRLNRTRIGSRVTGSTIVGQSFTASTPMSSTVCPIIIVDIDLPKPLEDTSEYDKGRDGVALLPMSSYMIAP